MNQREQRFVDTVREFYRVHKRAQLPWRKTRDPYKILISEIMLQQTQVERVLPKYLLFTSQWPTVEGLSQASLADVLKSWQGLGYNRRAKFLHQCAQHVVKEYNSTFPSSLQGLQDLPGIGPYTAGAVMAFAFNKPVVIIETNIKTVYLHHFFKNTSEVSESAILKLVDKTLDTTNPREWYWALMDYGSYLKKSIGNQNHRAKTYTRQSKFAGSNRQVRGAILRLLSEAAITKAALLKSLPTLESERVDEQLQALVQEGLVARNGRNLKLPD